MTARQNANGPAEAATSPSHGPNISGQETKMNERIDSTGVEFTPETIEEMKACALLPWNQWERRTDAWTPPTDHQWKEAINPHLVSVRLAFASMFQNREQTITAMEELEEQEIFQSLMDGIEGALEFFTPIVEVLQAAEARFMIAGSAIIIRQLEVQA